MVSVSFGSRTLMPDAPLPRSGSQNVFVEVARTGATKSAHGTVDYRSQLLSWGSETGTRFSLASGVGTLTDVSAASTQPAIDGWFATDGSGEPYLIGGKCHQCGTYVFPPRANNCPNPSCVGDELAQVPLSRRGTLWSYTENRYAPPPPYPSPDPFEPFAVAAVQLADEGLIVLGKVVEGTLAADLKIGMEMELTTMPLFVDDDGVERVVHAWRIA
jgi:uncharacterized OB-fold protein